MEKIIKNPKVKFLFFITFDKRGVIYYTFRCNKEDGFNFLKIRNNKKVVKLSLH